MTKEELKEYKQPMPLAISMLVVSISQNTIRQEVSFGNTKTILHLLLSNMVRGWLSATLMVSTLKNIKT